jgi:hypothetical protein
MPKSGYRFSENIMLRLSPVRIGRKVEAFGEFVSG